nr:FAD-binding oxidoreductase [Variovorax paradoxus]
MWIRRHRRTPARCAIADLTRKGAIANEIRPLPRHGPVPHPLPGLEQPRAFSLSKPPQSRNRLELNVRHVAGGKGTTYIHKALKVGDTLKISGPLGRFFVRKSDPQPVIFLAGGSGLSSPRSMILDLLEGDGDKRSITLIYGARDRSELYLPRTAARSDRAVRELPLCPRAE